MKPYAISDLDLGHEANRNALANITNRPEEWLILADDVGETATQLELAFKRLGYPHRWTGSTTLDRCAREIQPEVGSTERRPW